MFENKEASWCRRNQILSREDSILVPVGCLGIDYDGRFGNSALCFSFS